MRELVELVLAYVQDVMTKAKVELSHEESLYEISLTIIKTLELQCISSGIILNFQFPEDESFKNRKIQTNREALGKILNNLVTNAFKYASTSITLRIDIDDSAKEVLIEVHDDGIGIDPIHHKKIFEGFYQVEEASPQRKVGGGA